MALTSTRLRHYTEFDMASDITQRNVQTIDRDLRDIIKGIEKLRNLAYIHYLLRSIDALQSFLTEIIMNLSLISDLLELATTPKRRELLYQRISELPHLFARAINLIVIDEEKYKNFQNSSKYPEQLA